MNCPFCKHAESKVIDSRDSQDGRIIRRRRQCEKCEERFTTYERIEEVFPPVIKKDGRREDFDREKILQGIRKSCEKRAISVARQEECLAKVLQWVSEQELSEIPTSKIGEKVMEVLHDL
ncbi:MAG: transcriptional regulator NrdR, partial [Deltaproteobacteria bacterium]|nr:transcriptional regulator NrdR [Deltaproteobacteria bacterium]